MVAVTLKEWSGALKLYGRYREAGFGLIHFFADLASGLADQAFAPEEYIDEQRSRAESYVNGLFREHRPKATQGRCDQLFRDALTRTSDQGDLNQRFVEPLYAFKRAESETDVDDFQITRKVHIREYAERWASEHGYSLHKRGRGPFERLMVKTFGDWGLYTAFWIDIGGRDRSDPLSAEVDFVIGIGLEQGVGSPLDLRGIALPIYYYRDLVTPAYRKGRARDPRELSRLAKHAVRAQLWLAELLMSDLADDWRA